jgi:hypothetical protein
MDPSFRSQTSIFSSRTCRSTPSLQSHIALSSSSTFLMVNTSYSSHFDVYRPCIGYTGGFNEQQTDRDHPFEAANQPATLPRVSTIHVITERSPWCTTVRNESGVTLGDICGQVHKEYVLALADDLHTLTGLAISRMW